MSLPPFDHAKVTEFTEPPNPTWTYGQRVDSTPGGREWLEGEKQGWKTINTAEYDPLAIYKLLVGGIVPRPIAFVSTIDENGVENVAPFSWFNTVSSNPPTISISCSVTGRVKDTANNIKNGNGFTVNIISEPFIENANVASIDSPAGFDEWSITGLTKVPSIHVKASRVKESAFSMECELYKTIDITHPTTGNVTSILVLGHVKYFHIRNDVLTERGGVDISKLKPIGRLGDISYARIGDAFRLPRPVWDTEESKVKQVLQRL